MWEKLKNDKYVKDLLIKLVTVLFIAAMLLLLFDVVTKSRDGRRQIVDMDGGSEITQTQASAATSEERRLEQILSEIKGVGNTRVMITYQQEETLTSSVFSNESSNRSPKVEGVIVTCEGADNIIVKTNVINAVAAVFNIPATSVMVFEKSNLNE